MRTALDAVPAFWQRRAHRAGEGRFQRPPSIVSEGCGDGVGGVAIEVIPGAVVEAGGAGVGGAHGVVHSPDRVLASALAVSSPTKGVPLSAGAEDAVEADGRARAAPRSASRSRLSAWGRAWSPTGHIRLSRTRCSHSSRGRAATFPLTSCAAMRHTCWSQHRTLTDPSCGSCPLHLDRLSTEA